jgi:hydrogenase/urease accessory protein HupE
LSANRLHRLRALSILLLAFVGVLSAHAVLAHEVRPAYLQIQETAPDTFSVLWKQPAAGPLVLHLDPSVSNDLLNVPPTHEFAANSFVIRKWEGLHKSRDSFDGATIRVDGLKETITDALLSVSFLGGQDIQTVLKPSSPSTVIHLTGTGKLPVPAYLRLGVEHILTGFDHLSFVLGLVLLIRSRVLLLKTITAFTVAHSITLAASALGHVHPSPPVIEALVALSIVFVALELVRGWQGDEGLTVRRPWIIAFTFGLLHGFAFAGSLADIGLPPHNIPLALLLFNCGVEIGQLLFVGAALFVIAALRSLPVVLRQQLRFVVPYGIGTLATYWMFERLHVLIH